MTIAPRADAAPPSAPGVVPVAPITVASVPAGHVYVQHLGAVDGNDGVRRLPDPRPCTAPSDQSVWWPPAMLDPAWVRASHELFDVFHLHFGFDAETPESLEELVQVLRRHGKPLIYTVHDLRNPHHVDPRIHRAHLDVLVPAADQLITLTGAAASVIRSEWGRRAQVLPHPHVVDLPLLATPRGARSEFVFGVHLKSLRANMSTLPVLAPLADEVSGLPDAVLRVDVHAEVFDPAGPHHDAELVSWLKGAEQRGALRVDVHDFYSDERLWRYLRDEIDVSVLPYRFGTHSGWLEACHDLGTTVVAPSCGFYAQQRPCLEYGLDETGCDPDSLRRAVREAHRKRPLWRAGERDRRRERDRVAAAHARLYARALSGERC